MRRIPAVVTGALAALILAGCAQQNPPLYMWDKFPRQQYDFLLGDGADLGRGEGLACVEAEIVHAEVGSEGVDGGRAVGLEMATGDGEGLEYVSLAVVAAMVA